MIFQKLLQSFSSDSRPSVALQVVSDLHLEINQQYPSFQMPVCAKYLILGGDTGRLADYDKYLEFVREQTQQFEKVLLVLGNHEFYGGPYAAGLRRAKRLEQEPSLNGKLVVLHQRRYDIPGSNVTILGCTLWSHVPNEKRAIVERKVQDFCQIDGWKISSHNTAHEADLAWLLRETASIREGNRKLAKQDQRSVVVVTHHAPSLQKTSSPQNEQNSWACAFGSDLLHHASAGVKLWVFGNTHHTTEFKYKGTRVVSNQRGYVFPWLQSTASKSKNSNKNGSKNKFDAGKVIRV